METIIVINFGGQYSQLIARRVRENGVFCEIMPYTASIDKIRRLSPKGIIFSGGPDSVYETTSPCCSKEIFDLNIPLLGICYGAQLMTHMLGGKVEPASVSEYGHTEVIVDERDALLLGVEDRTVCWMSHTDYISGIPQGFRVTAHTAGCPVAAMSDTSRNLYALQFHPEVMHTQEGMTMLRNFLFVVCNCTGNWKMSSFVEDAVAELRNKIGKSKVLCALSGGVDSSVAAVLLSKAIGKQLTCVFVDHGLLRKNEGDEIEAVFGSNGPYELNFIRVNAGQRFYKKLKGVTDPEKKRKIIGREFIRVFEKEARKIGKVDFLVQGTIYPDVVESGFENSALIKSHHNVGGLPKRIGFREIVEPLRMLFKDEVRRLGLELGMPEDLIYRQPFPGPGLGIRIIGSITEEKVRILQEADAICREEIENSGLGRNIAQYFAVLTNVRSVGVMGDFRTYQYAAAIRAVETDDFMTADAAKLPWDVLDRISGRIVNEIKGISRVLYDCTGKPPGTVEWE